MASLQDVLLKLNSRIKALQRDFDDSEQAIAEVKGIVNAFREEAFRAELAREEEKDPTVDLTPQLNSITARMDALTAAVAVVNARPPVERIEHTTNTHTIKEFVAKPEDDTHLKDYGFEFKNGDVRFKRNDGSWGQWVPLMNGGGGGGSTGSADQNVWTTITADTGSTVADTTTDALSVVGTGGIVTSITGDILTIDGSAIVGGGDPDQNIWETVATDAGSSVANTTTDTLTITGSGGITTSATGDTITIDASGIVVGDPDQNLWETVVSDSGSAVANTTTDSLTVTGSGGITTAIVGDVLTIDGTGLALGDPDQNLWETVTADTGSTTANTTTDSLSVVGAGGLSTSITGDVLTIDGSGLVLGDPDQNLWATITGDTGTTTANTTTDTLSVVGAGGLVTSVSGDVLTIDASAIVASGGVVDARSARWVLSGNQTLTTSVGGTTTVIDYDTTTHDTDATLWTNNGAGLITINEAGIYVITCALVIESPTVSALTQTQIGVRLNGATGDVITGNGDSTTLALGNNLRVLCCSVTVELAVNDTIAGIVQLFGTAANGLAVRLPALFGTTLTNISHISITKQERSNIDDASIQERIEDVVGSFVVGGTGITSTYSDAGGTLTLSNDGVTSFAARTGAVVATAGDYDAFYYTETEMDASLALKAPLASPALTGNPTAPTAAPGDNDTSIATTAFVTAADTAASTSDRARANHTGTQLASTISDFAATVRSTILTGLSLVTGTAIAATDTVLVAFGKLQTQITNNLATLTGHTGNISNPHAVTKTQVGLSNVDNTSDVDKPVSTAQAAANTTDRDRANHTGTQLLSTISDAGTMASQNASSVAITGGTIDGTVIGGTTPAAADFTTMDTTGVATVGANLNVSTNITLGSSNPVSGLMKINKGSGVGRVDYQLLGVNSWLVGTDGNENYLLQDRDALGAAIDTAVTIRTGAGLDVDVNRPLDLAAGLKFTNATGASTSDLSKHIALWGTVYGFGITGSRMNAVIPTLTSFYVVGNGSDRLRVNADGRLSGNALHNNASAITGTTDQYVASGTWIPTVTAVSNIDSVGSYSSQYSRVGNVVTCSGMLYIDPTTAATSTHFRINLPIASNFVNIINGNGTCTSTAASVDNMGVWSDLTADEMNFRGLLSHSTAVFYSFHFTYLIL